MVQVMVIMEEPVVVAAVQVDSINNKIILTFLNWMMMMILKV
jgi:hypothetical protein